MPCLPRPPFSGKRIDASVSPIFHTFPTKYIYQITRSLRFYVCQFSTIRFDDFNGIYVSHYTIAEQRLIKFGNGDKGGCHGGGYNAGGKSGYKLFFAIFMLN